MSLNNLVASFIGSRVLKVVEVMNYEEVFKGSACAPVTMAEHSGHFLPGLRAVQNDVDIYFKEVFAGPVF